MRDGWFRHPRYADARRDHGLRAPPGGGVGEGLLDPARAGTSRRQPLHPELRQQRERAAEGGAAAVGAVDADLAEVVSKRSIGIRLPLGLTPTSCSTPVGFTIAKASRDQLRLAHRLAHHLRAAAPGQRHHALGQALAGRIHHHARAELARDLPPLLERIGEDQARGAPPAGQHHGEEPHDPAAHDHHGGVARHREHLEPGEAAGGGLGERGGDRVEPLRQRVHAVAPAAPRARRSRPPGWPCAHWLIRPCLQCRHVAAAVSRLAGDRPADELAG